MKHELQDIISGNGSVRNGEIIQTITAYLRGKKKTVSSLEKGEFSKLKETKILIQFIEDSGLWYSSIDNSTYIGEGAEQKIYEFSDPDFVLKLNDTIFYSSWEDYFHSLLIHNYFFPHLAYELMGFTTEHGKLFSVVKQSFVKATENTNLQNVKDFLSSNGFINKKENDYFHPEIGIILEDLHDENVLTSEGVLQFIDTVFFLTENFYKTD
ncbi:MAG: hypothetical protein IAF38_20550 [Bacteroidia bacterium]|nr:hypothetical protein [Bacteroidia bacterium]